MTTTTRMPVARTDVPSGMSYENLVQRFEETLGTWDASAAQQLVERHALWAEVEVAATKAGRSLGLMIIAKLDQGQLTSLSGHVKKCRLYLVGNPVIASGILDIDPQAVLYVPFRVALFEADGSKEAYITFDRPGSSLALLGNAAIDEIGRQLDAKIDAAVQAVCSSG